MSSDAARVVLLAALSLGLIVVSVLLMDWFVARDLGAQGISTLAIDLRAARACAVTDHCVAAPAAILAASYYPSFAAVTFWGALFFGLLVLFQACTFVIGAVLIEPITKVAHVSGFLVILTAVAAGFIAMPVLDPRLSALGHTLDRTPAPAALLLALLIAHLALYYTRGTSTYDDGADYTPVDPVPIAVARAKTIPPAERTRPPTLPQIPRTKTATAPQIPRVKTDTLRQKKITMPIPEIMKGKVAYAVVVGDVTAAGIDARREDGHAILVMWRDVVGVVARRMPVQLESQPFVDIVSTAGMTLRIMPWTKLTGDDFEIEGTERERAFAMMLVERCDDAKLDRATQEFVDGMKPPAQLSSLELLAKHDQALA